jgi:dipeptidyl aminopeptidase/acylaminoacyl peptidase
LPALIVGERNKERVVGVEPEAAAIIWSVDIPPASKIMATGRRSGAVLYLVREANGVASLFLDSPQASARRLDTINRHLSDIDVPRGSVVRTTSPDGRPLAHWLTLPKGGDKAPLVVLPYPGYERGDRPAPIDLSEFRSYQNVALLVGAGYAVLQPSIPTEIAPNRQKTEFGLRGTLTEAARVPDDFATDRFFDDMTAIVLGAVDAAVATGRIDPQRLAIYGHSYGGDAVAGIVTRTDRFDAAIASHGVYNLLGAYGAMYVRDAPELGLPTGMISWFEAGQGGLGAPPWHEVQGYVSRSPYFAVEHIRTPLMLFHGDTDFLPVQNAEQMFIALHRLGRDALLVRYAGEGHTLVSPANTQDRWSRMLKFLRQNLRGGPVQSRQ